MKPSLLVTALLLQVAAQAFGGPWGAAIGGLLIGLALRGAGAFRTGFVAAFLAAGLLIMVAALRGAEVLRFADMLGGNFKLPGVTLLAVTLLLPAVQSGGLAGGVARLMRRR